MNRFLIILYDYFVCHSGICFANSNVRAQKINKKLHDIVNFCQPGQRHVSYVQWCDCSKHSKQVIQSTNMHTHIYRHAPQTHEHNHPCTHAHTHACTHAHTHTHAHTYSMTGSQQFLHASTESCDSAR